MIETFAHPRGPGEPARVAGILNLTPDSFSDGGRYAHLDEAVDAARRMEEEGAAFVDVGGVSTRPGAEPVSLDEERRRVLPVVEALARVLSIPISIDTYRAAVFREAHAAGAAILNDVTALGEGEAMCEVLRETGAPAILMHMRGSPLTMQDAPRYDDVVREVGDFFAARLALAAKAGIAADKFVLDPGIGFGKTLAHNLELLRAIPALTARFGRPLLYGTSRKTFIGKILDRSEPREREWGTAATTAYLHQSGARYLRVHHVRAAVDLIDVLHAIEGGAS